jgi:hypothetical protein
MDDIFRYTILVEPSPRELEADIALAVYCAECLFGQPQVRHEVRYFITSDGRRCVVAAKGPAGSAVARLLTGLCAQRMGEASFSVERLHAVPFQDEQTKREARRSPRWKSSEVRR